MYLLYLVIGEGKTIPVLSIVLLAAIYGLQALIFIFRLRWDMIAWMVCKSSSCKIHDQHILNRDLPQSTFWLFPCSRSSCLFTLSGRWMISGKPSSTLDIIPLVDPMSRFSWGATRVLAGQKGKVILVHVSFRFVVISSIDCELSTHVNRTKANLIQSLFRKRHGVITSRFFLRPSRLSSRSNCP